MSLFTNGTNCRLFKMGRTAHWVELSLFGIWDELSLWTNRRSGRIVAQLKLFSTAQLLNFFIGWPPLIFSRIFPYYCLKFTVKENRFQSLEGELFGCFLVLWDESQKLWTRYTFVFYRLRLFLNKHFQKKIELS